MPDQLGQAVLELRTDDSKLDLKTAHDRAESLGKKFVAVGATITAIGAPFALATKSALDTADGFAKMSQRTGVTVESLSGLAHAAGLSGSSIEAVDTSFVRLAANMADTARGTGEAKEAFEALGVNVKNTDGSLRSSEQIMLEIADRFSEMEDGAAKSAAATDIFGRSGAALIPLLNEGSSGIKTMTDEAASLGLVLSGEAAASSERFNDALDRLSGAFKGVVNSLLESGLIDALTDFLESGAKIIGTFTKAHPTITATGVAFGTLGAAVGPAAIGIGLSLPAIKNLTGSAGPLITKLGGVEGAFKTLGKAGTIGAAAFIGWEIGKLIGDMEWFRKVTEGVVKSLQPLVDRMSGVTEANKNLRFATEQLAAKLKEKGIVVEQGSKTIGEWRTELMQASQGLVTHTAEAAKNTQAVVQSAEAIEKAKAAAEKLKLEFRELIFPLIDATEGLTSLDEAGQLVFQTWGDIEQSLRDAQPALIAIIGDLETLTLGTDASASAVDLLDTSVIDLAGGLRDFEPRLDDVSQAMKDLGLETDNLRQQKLDKLKIALEQMEQAFLDGKISADQLKAAQEAYAKAVDAPRGPKEATGGLQRAMDDLVGSLGDVGTHIITFTRDGGIAFGFGSTLETLKQKAIALVNEGINLLINSLLKLVGLGGDLGSFSGIIKNLFGGGAQAGGVAGGVGGVGGGIGGGLGSAAGVGLNATLGTIFGGASAISGIIGNFQQARLEGTMNAVELNTRVSAIHLLHILENSNKYWPWLQSIGEAAGPLWSIHQVLATGVVLSSTGGAQAIVDQVSQGADQTSEGLRNLDAALAAERDDARSFRSRVGSGIDRISEESTGARSFRARTAGGVETLVQDTSDARSFRSRVGSRLDEISQNTSQTTQNLLSLRDLNPTRELIQQINRSIATTPIAGPAFFQGNPVTDILPQTRGGSRSRIPSFQSGIDFLPSDTFLFAHRGEAIIPAEENARRLSQRERPIHIELKMDRTTVASLMLEDINQMVKKQSFELTASRLRG